jgi:hypothetical protein
MPETPHVAYTPAEFGLGAQLKEVRRELGLRRHFYPKMVTSGKLNAEDAERRIAALEAVEITLTGLLPKEEELKQPRLL